MRLSNAAMGRGLMVLSIGTRFGVLVLICLLALWTEYLNLKVGYGNWPSQCSSVPCTPC